MKKITFTKVWNYGVSRIRRLLPRKSLRYIDWMLHGDRTPVYGGKSFEIAYNQAFSDMEGGGKDAKKCFLKYGFTPLDYKLFGFESTNTSDEQRRSFVADWEKDALLIQKEGWNNYLELSDKYGFYLKLRPFYKREIMLIDANTKSEEFIRFARQMRHLFIKPNSDSYGNGAKVFDYGDDNQAAQFFDGLSGASWIVEERICQSVDMAKWNESSVNTVRVNTFLNKNGFFVLAPFMRTGRKGSIVDNGGAGGMFALIDEKDGMIITDAHNEKGESFAKHPDSAFPFKGQFIPQWSELLSIAKRAHKAVPHHLYISWDFALTDKGWCVIEGNWGQFIAQQTCAKQGFKKQFFEYMNGGRIVDN